LGNEQAVEGIAVNWGQAMNLADFRFVNQQQFKTGCRPLGGQVMVRRLG
jgi:hypothetical protein